MFVSSSTSGAAEDKSSLDRFRATPVHSTSASVLSSVALVCFFWSLKCRKCTRGYKMASWIVKKYHIEVEPVDDSLSWLMNLISFSRVGLRTKSPRLAWFNSLKELNLAWKDSLSYWFLWSGRKWMDHVRRNGPRKQTDRVDRCCLSRGTQNNGTTYHKDWTP